MISIDYLYNLLTESPIEGYLISGRRYSMCTTRDGGIWKVAVCQHIREHVRIMTDWFPDTGREEAWETFLAARHPGILHRWKMAEQKAKEQA